MNLLSSEEVESDPIVQNLNEAILISNWFYTSALYMNPTMPRYC